jgi:hypothetical protein
MLPLKQILVKKNPKNKKRKTEAVIKNRQKIMEQVV